MLSYSSHELNGVVVLTADKADVQDGQPAERDWLYQLTEVDENLRFVIDLSHVDYMASADIGVLITLKRRIDARQGKLVLFGVDSFIQDVLRTMRLDKYFVIVDSFDDAMAAISG